MIPARPRRIALVIVIATAGLSGGAAPRAEAFNPLKPVCAVGGLVSGIVGKACTAVSNGGRLISAGKKLASGHLGGAIKTVLGDGGSSVGSKATFALGLAAVVTWVLGGAKYALHETARVIGRTTAPRLESTWFSAAYWRVAGIAAVLTLPFLFATAIQALVHSDLSLLIRAALGYLPLATLAVGIAAPVTMLLLAASDQMSAVVSSAAGNASAHFLDRASGVIGGITLITRSPFLVFFAGLLTVGGAVVLWFELLLRAAAVYVIVLMLPLVFAALVWPARRVWAVRAVELLIALILSKFVIVAVLSLGGAALSESTLSSVAGLLAGFVLLAMAAMAPWVLLRLLPLGELASATIGSWRGEASGAGTARLGLAWGGGLAGHEWASTTSEMRRQAEEASMAPDLGARALPPAEQTTLGTDPGRAAARDAGQSEEAANAEPPLPVAPTSGLAGADAATADDAVRERSPGLGSIWQAENFSWPETVLGLDQGWPPRPLEDEITERSNGRVDVAEQPPNGSVPVDSGGLDGVAHEDHDPTPPPQQPEAGAL